MANGSNGGWSVAKLLMAVLITALLGWNGYLTRELGVAQKERTENTKQVAVIRNDIDYIKGGIRDIQDTLNDMQQERRRR